MLTYPEIRTRPPQNPRPGEDFSSSDLYWNRVKKGRKEDIDNVAVIPFSRVQNFVNGEESRDGYTTQFTKDVTRGKGVSPDNPRADAILISLRYHCRYGPDDNREHGICRASRKCLKPSEKNGENGGRPTIKAGCQCRFFVKRYVRQPDVAFILYNHQQHMDRNGYPCHDEDRKARPKQHVDGNGSPGHGKLYEEAHKARPTWLFEKRGPLDDMVTPKWIVKKKRTRTARSEKIKVE